MCVWGGKRVVKSDFSGCYFHQGLFGIVCARRRASGGSCLGRLTVYNSIILRIL